MTRILLQRRQSVANNAIQNCAFLRGGEEKDLENEKKKKEKEDRERRCGALYETARRTDS